MVLNKFKEEYISSEHTSNLEKIFDHEIYLKKNLEFNKYILLGLYVILEKHDPEDKDYLFLFELAYTGYDSKKIIDYYENEFKNKSERYNLYDGAFDPEFTLPSSILQRGHINNEVKRIANVVSKCIYTNTTVDNKALFLAKKEEYLLKRDFTKEFNIRDYSDPMNFAQCVQDSRYTNLNNIVPVYIQNGKQYTHVLDSNVAMHPFVNHQSNNIVLNKDKYIMEPGTKLEYDPISMKLTHTSIDYDASRLDYDASNSIYLSEQQKYCIEEMEKLEENPVFIYTEDRGEKSECFLNRLAVKTNFGVLSNLPGTGKTRIAVMVALRNKTRAALYPINYIKEERRIYEEYSMSKTPRVIEILKQIEVYKEPNDTKLNELIKQLNEYKKHNNAKLNEMLKQLDAYKEADPFMERYQPDVEFFLENLDTNEFIQVDRLAGDARVLVDESAEFNLRKYRLTKSNATLIAVSESTFLQWEQEIENTLREYKLVDEYTIEHRDIGCTSYVCKKETTGNILLVSDKYYNNNMMNYLFNRVIFDEPDTVSYENKSIFYRFKWYVSATVGSLYFNIDNVLPKYTPNVMSSFTSKIPPPTLEFNKLPYIQLRGSASYKSEVVDKIYKNLNIFTPILLNNEKKIVFSEYTGFADVLLIKNFKSHLDHYGKEVTELLSSGDIKTMNMVFPHKEYHKIDNFYLEYIKDYNKYTNLLSGLEVLMLLDESNPALEDIRLGYKSNIAKIESKLNDLDECTLKTLIFTSECIICKEEITELSNTFLYNCCNRLACCSDCSKKPCLYCDTSIDNNINNIVNNINNNINGMPNAFMLKHTLFYNRIKNKLEQNNKKKTYNTRYEQIKNIVSANNSKTILYSTSCDNKLLDNLDRDKINYKILQGTIQQRGQIINEWKESTEPITLVLLEHRNIAGLNLTDATDIIIYNHVSTSVLLQVVGRVDRYGLPEDHIVNIHLLHPDTIEIPEKYKNSKILKVNIDNITEVKEYNPFEEEETNEENEEKETNEEAYTSSKDYHYNEKTYHYNKRTYHDMYYDEHEIITDSF